jgi:hypothetical protein
LPAGVSGVGGGEALGQREEGLEAVERVHKVALRDQHVADLVMRDGEVALTADKHWTPKC